MTDAESAALAVATASAASITDRFACAAEGHRMQQHHARRYGGLHERCARCSEIAPDYVGRGFGAWLWDSAARQPARAFITYGLAIGTVWTYLLTVRFFPAVMVGSCMVLGVLCLLWLAFLLGTNPRLREDAATQNL